MIIKRLHIKNFKAFPDEDFEFQNHSLIIGENDSGKSSLLLALDLLFNGEKVEKKDIIDLEENVEIEAWFDNGGYVAKTFSPKQFKQSVRGDASLLIKYHYIYISPQLLDVKKIIAELASARIDSLVSDDIKTELDNCCNKAIKEILESIDNDLIVVNQNGTKLIANHILTLGSVAKYTIESDGLPIESHGTGYQKNLLYAVLTRGLYENVILGIDEIENSFSLNNVRYFIDVVKTKYNQTLFSTHSSFVLNEYNPNDVIALIKGKLSTLAILLPLVGTTKEETFILVEGKTDVKWVYKALELLNLLDSYIVIPCYGSENIDPLFEELSRRSRKCIRIKDGDTKDEENSLKKDVIELYMPLPIYKEVLDPNADALPETKTELENACYSLKGSKEFKWLKRLLSSRVNDFLTIDNEFVKEINKILTRNKQL